MDISGSYTFDAPPDRVWALLMDPAIIASCIPGCEGFEPSGEDSYRIRLHVALAAITGSYEGTVALSDLTPTTSYCLTAEGRGKPGFVKGSAVVTLLADGETTIAGVAGTVHTGGAIARLGQRLVKGVSQMMLDRFFASLRRKLTP